MDDVQWGTDDDHKVTAECPPFRRIEFEYGAEFEGYEFSGDSIPAELIPDSLPFSLRFSLGLTNFQLAMRRLFITPFALRKSKRLHSKLQGRWQQLWPTLHRELEKLVQSYDRPVPLTPDIAKFSITQPGHYEGFDFEEWSIGVEHLEWNGDYSIHFDLEGNILDSSVSF